MGCIVVNREEEDMEGVGEGGGRGDLSGGGILL